MRLTIVDKQMNVVREVLESPVPSDVLGDDFADFLRDYRSADYRWFVTIAGEMPEHAQHNQWGQIL